MFPRTTHLASRLARRTAQWAPERSIYTAQAKSNRIKTYAVATVVGVTVSRGQPSHRQFIAHIQAYYFASQPLKADSKQSPAKGDKTVQTKPSSSTGKGATKGQKGGISISDVVKHKEGDEVWVVIKGDVYKYVPLHLF